MLELEGPRQKSSASGSAEDFYSSMLMLFSVSDEEDYSVTSGGQSSSLFIKRYRSSNSFTFRSLATTE